VVEIPWTFKTWIANFKDVDLPIGDLAVDILRDPSFPDSEDYSVLRSHIMSKQRDRVVMETFETVWNFYQASR
jgi:uncharacterized protein YozE (UPF0346 family)